VPEIVLALKQTVDRDPRPGGFLVAGLASLLRLPRAGRPRRTGEQIPRTQSKRRRQSLSLP